LAEDNRIVHGMWIGSRLSKLELLTISSFLRHGHDFHLWLYEDLETPLPRGVVLEDANTIIPRSRVFCKREIDEETGVGCGSYGAPFSDLFRYKLLYEKGGYWADMDITCLRPLSFPDAYVFRTHKVGVVGNIMKCPPKSALMRETYNHIERIANEDTPWLLPNRILTGNIYFLGLQQFIRKEICNEDSWIGCIKALVYSDQSIPSSWFVIHWINEFWRTLSASGGYYRGRKLFDCIPDKNHPSEGSTLARLYEAYGLA
jgi:hypothetical protein